MPLRTLRNAFGWILGDPTLWGRSNGKKYCYAELYRADQPDRAVFTTRDCPCEALAIVRDGVIYVLTDEFSDHGGQPFRVFVEEHRTWRAKGALEA